MYEELLSEEGTKENKLLVNENMRATNIRTEKKKKKTSNIKRSKKKRGRISSKVFYILLSINIFSRSCYRQGTIIGMKKKTKRNYDKTNSTRVQQRKDKQDSTVQTLIFIFSTNPKHTHTKEGYQSEIQPLGLITISR